MKDAFCKDITVGEVVVTTQVKGDAIQVNVVVDDIQLFCFGTVEFEVAGLTGSLNFEATAGVPTTDVDLLLVSNDLDTEFPSSGCVTSCSAPVQVESLVIDDVHVDSVPNEIVDVVVEALTEPVIEAIETLGGDGKELTMRSLTSLLNRVSLVQRLTHLWRSLCNLSFQLSVRLSTTSPQGLLMTFYHPQEEMVLETSPSRTQSAITYRSKISTFPPANQVNNS